jgi:hypothetical protein
MYSYVLERLQPFTVEQRNQAMRATQQKADKEAEAQGARDKFFGK